MGLILYYTGCAERQLGRLDEADRCYGDAINEYHARAELALGAVGPPKLAAELALVRHNTAVILGLGLGWTNSQRGHLRRALDSNVVPAQALLMTSIDQTHRSYLSLLRGSIIRSLVGSSKPDILEDAKKSIENALRDFIKSPYCHESYALRAEYELALCSLTGGDFDGARRWVDKMEARAKQPQLQDVRWQANAWIVRSRITSRQGRNPEQARREADMALTLMSDQEEALGVIDARIARAEAFLHLGQPRAAREDLVLALTIVEEHCKPNQKIESVLHILLARSHILENDTRLAEAELHKWDQVKENVEHAFVHEMAGKVSEQLRRIKHDFTIPWATTDLRHDEHERRLRAWLVHRAYYERRDNQTKADVAALLGIARTTLNYWEDELQRELEDIRNQLS